MLRRYRLWRVNRHIERILREVGCPGSPAMFTGNVTITEVRYPC